MRDPQRLVAQPCSPHQTRGSEATPAEGGSRSALRTGGRARALPSTTSDLPTGRGGLIDHGFHTQSSRGAGVALQASFVDALDDAGQPKESERHVEVPAGDSLTTRALAVGADELVLGRHALAQREGL